MNKDDREKLKQKILSRYELYKLQGSRVKRVLKDPFLTIPYFIKQRLAYIKPYKVKKETLWGDTMEFYLPEGGMIYYYGFWEANLANFFINFLKEGDIFFDIGAHVGYYSMLASALVGNSGKVISFEPTPRTFESLNHNAESRKNVETYNNAVLDKEIELEFFDYGPKYSAFNSFKKRTDENIAFRNDAKKIRVKTIALDDFCKNKKLSPTLIKIDAEGAEHLILKSMDYVLSEIKPCITIEVGGGEEWKENCAQSIAVLKGHGYLPYEITLEGLLKEHAVRDIYFYDNLLFVHQSKSAIIQPFLA